MAKYHKYIFDEENRKFVGDFDGMYRQEGIENFDGWHQEDSRQLQRKILLSIYEQKNYWQIIDIGCGKGAFTHLLKKKNNSVLGIDISAVAINQAQARYPDIDFLDMDISKLLDFEKFLINKRYCLAVISECLSYLENWELLLEVLSRYCKEVLIASYIPSNPIGFVKSHSNLNIETSKNFEIIETVRLEKSNFSILYAKSKNA
jgi:trans-aconitate methyltransferase